VELEFAPQVPGSFADAEVPGQSRASHQFSRKSLHITKIGRNESNFRT